MQDELDEVVGDAVSADGPGCAVGLVANSRLQCVAVRGFANLEHAVPITPTTVFHVASVSKPVVAYACALLAERGELDLDARVEELLDGFPFPAVTIRQLVHHVSGLRDQWELLVLSGRQLEDVITTAEIRGLVQAQRELNFEPGSGLAYSNTGYTLLAEMIERVSGSSLRDFTAAEIFQPLGMVDSRFVDDHHEVVEGRADSYWSNPDAGWRRVALSYSTAGATSLNTTVPDLARWVVNAMTPRGRRLLEQRHTLTDGTPIGYAMGVWLEAGNGRTLVEHSGGDAGYRAHLAMFPEDGVAGIAVSNHAACPVYRLAHRAAGLVLEDSRRRPPAGPPDMLPDAGLYLDSRAGRTYALAPTEGGAVMLGESRFTEVRPGLFASENNPTVELLTEPPVRLRSPTMSERELEPVEPWAPAPEDLDRFAGHFWSAELCVRWTVIRAGDSAWIHQPRWGRLVLTPTLRNAFAVSVPLGSSEVRVDLQFDDEASELFASTNRVTRLRFVRASFDRGR